MKVISIGICQPALFNQKHSMDGFYQDGLLISSEYVLYTFLVEAIPTRFCWLSCRKQKLVRSKILQQGLFVLISSCHFRQVFAHYLMSIWCYANKQVAIPFLVGLVQKKNKHEKFPSLATNNWIVLAVRWSVKYFFAQNSQYSGKLWRRRKLRKRANAKRFALQANAVRISWKL